MNGYRDAILSAASSADKLRSALRALETCSPTAAAPLVEAWNAQRPYWVIDPDEAYRPAAGLQGAWSSEKDILFIDPPVTNDPDNFFTTLAHELSHLVDDAKLDAARAAYHAELERLRGLLIEHGTAWEEDQRHAAAQQNYEAELAAFLAQGAQREATTRNRNLINGLHAIIQPPSSSSSAAQPPKPPQPPTPPATPLPPELRGNSEIAEHAAHQHARQESEIDAYAKSRAVSEEAQMRCSVALGTAVQADDPDCKPLDRERWRDFIRDSGAYDHLFASPSRQQVLLQLAVALDAERAGQSPPPGSSPTGQNAANEQKPYHLEEEHPKVAPLEEEVKPVERSDGESSDSAAGEEAAPAEGLEVFEAPPPGQVGAPYAEPTEPSGIAAVLELHPNGRSRSLSLGWE